MITRIRISKVDASRPVDEAIVNMKFNINFDNVKVDGDNVEVEYTFMTTYEGEKNAKSVGELKILGTVFAKEDKAMIQEIQDAWTKKKTLPVRFAEDVINILNFECASRGTLLAWSIGMIAPLPITRAKLQENESEK